MRYFTILTVFLFSISQAMAQGGCSVSLGEDVSVCNGNPVTLTAITTGQDGLDSLRIIYDATQGVSGLSGASSVYFHSGVQTVAFGGWEYTVGNWGVDDGLGQMTSLGNNLWQITIHVESYYGFPGGTNVNGLWMVFRNADGTATGKDDLDEDIFLFTSNGNTTDFGGITGTDLPGSTGSLLWSTNETTPSISVTQGGTYSVTYTDGSGCVSSDEVVVQISTGTVSVDLGPDTSFCGSFLLTLDAGAGYPSYLWSTLETTQTIQVDSSGDYTITVTDGNGCQGVDLIHISEGVLPDAEFSSTPTTGLTVEFTDESTDAITVDWDLDGDGTFEENSPGGGSVSHTYSSESVYGVVMIAHSSCGNDTVSHNVLVQNVGIEDVLQASISVFPNPATNQIVVSNIDGANGIRGVQIFDFTGREMKQITPINMGGIFKLELLEVPAGVYFLQIITDKGILTNNIIKQ